MEMMRKLWGNGKACVGSGVLSVRLEVQDSDYHGKHGV